MKVASAGSHDRVSLQQKYCHYDWQLVESERAINAAKKTKSRVAQKQAGRRWSVAEEQAAKRTNIESPPGGEGHVASNNTGAGMAL